MEEIKKEEPKKSHVFLNIFIIFIILISLLYLYSRYIEPSKLVVKEYGIASENLDSNFSGLKIIHFSDIYWGNTTYEENLEAIVKKINKLKPDLVIFTGNLTDNKYKNIDKLKESLSSIDATLGKYAIKGNLDYNNKYDSIMEEVGFTVLNNKYELIYNDGLTPIYLCGLGSYLEEDSKLEACTNYLDTLTKDTQNKPNYKILLTHEGDSVKSVLKNKQKFDLILSGNSLNGTIDLPYYGPIFIPDGSKTYISPHYTRGDTEIYISSGIGTDKYPYRLFNPPSFNLYRLKSLK